MKPARIFTALVIAALTISFVYAASIDELKKEAVKVGRNMKAYAGSSIEFVDDAAYICKNNENHEGFLRFNTKNIPCRISLEKEKEIKLLKTIIDKEIAPHLVHISGTVVTVNDFSYFCEVDTLTRVSYKETKSEE